MAPIRKILAYNGMLPCLVPSWPQIMQIHISCRSRSDLVLDADNALDFISISFCRRASRFIVFQTKVAHLCFCLVRKKCRCSCVLTQKPGNRPHFDESASGNDKIILGATLRIMGHSRSKVLGGTSPQPHLQTSDLSLV